MKYIFLLIVLFLSLPSMISQITKLQVESNHSTIGFSIPIAGFTEVTGKFTKFEIFLDWNSQNITQSKISAKIKANSINTGIPDRDSHLQSEDFFDVEKFPLITFESDSIQQVNFAHFTAFGTLTMHGVAKPFQLPFEIVKMDGNTIGIRSKTMLNRLDFGVGNSFKHTSMPNFLAKIIQVNISFWTKKRKE